MPEQGAYLVRHGGNKEEKDDAQCGDPNAASFVQDFTDEQKHYLQGFVSGAQVARATRGSADVRRDACRTGTARNSAVPPTANRRRPAPTRYSMRRRTAFLAEGKKLCAEEQAKRRKHPLDMWDDVAEHAADGRFPKGTDVFP